MSCPEEIAFAITYFVHLLRLLGLRVSVAETEDVYRALPLLDLQDKKQVEGALQALLVKNPYDRLIFQEAFSLFFSSGDDFKRLLDGFRREKEQEEFQLHKAGQELADLVSGWEEQIKEDLVTPENVRIFSLLPERAKERLKKAITQTKANPVNSPGELIAWTVRSTLSYWRRHLKDEMTKSSSLCLPGTRLAIFSGSPEERILYEDMQKIGGENLAALTEMIRRLSFRLARSLNRRYRRSSSARAVDFRRTFRRNIRWGGVPLELHFRRRRRRRPKLIFICDVSASMARYAEFVLQFTYGLAGAVEKVEGFVFSEDLERITPFLKRGRDFATVMTELVNGSRQWGRTTNLAAALATLWREYRELVEPDSILIILSDAKTAAWEEASRMLAELSGKVRETIWLNPVPAAHWADLPAVAAFQKSVRMFECNSLYHLEKIFRQKVG